MNCRCNVSKPFRRVYSCQLDLIFAVVVGHGRRPHTMRSYSLCGLAVWFWYNPSSPRDVQSASRPVRELAIRELAYPRVVQ